MHQGKQGAALAIAYPVNVDRGFRRRIEAAVERLIAVLDVLDGDPDLEAGADDEDGHDRELDPADDGIADKAAMKFVLAKMARRSRQRRR